MEKVKDGSTLSHTDKKEMGISGSGSSEAMHKGLRVKKSGNIGKDSSGVIEWVKSTHAQIEAISRKVKEGVGGTPIAPDNPPLVGT
ncbi:hypothetical protein V6N13_008125 [Hibiscus sabdariffa]